MDLSSNYLGISLPHPIVSGAGPLAGDIGVARRLEDAGVAMIVLHSLFEEQLTQEQLAGVHTEQHSESFAEALSYFPEPEAYDLGPDEYLRHLARVKQAVDVPVVASLNGVTPGGWLRYARLMADAGADALELNVYMLATDPGETAQAIEDRTVAMVRQVVASIDIPVAVKLSPFYTSLPNLASRLVEAGARGLVIFNRFYQPDIDLENLEVMRINFSGSGELLPRLRWVAILHGRIAASLAITGGVHTPEDAVKSVMVGADAVQMVSALLEHGPAHVTRIRDGLAQWLEENEYDSIHELRGSMSLLKCPDPAAYERANYMRLLHSYRP